MTLLKFAKIIAKPILQGHLSALSNAKYYAQWTRSMKPGHSSVTDRLPWITFAAIDALKKKLHNKSKVFEFGGGGSTLFFLDRADEIVTIEHNREWFALLQKEVAMHANKSWKGQLIVPEDTTVANGDPSNPDEYYSQDHHFTGKIFKAYASAIDDYPDNYFDVVLVDGRVRPSCIKHSKRKISTGGFLVLDNADRDYYLKKSDLNHTEFELILEKKCIAPFTGFLSQTNIWVKK